LRNDPWPRAAHRCLVVRFSHANDAEDSNVRPVVLCAIVALGPGLAAAATIYKSTDEKGKVIYSDEPRPGAVKIEIPTEPAGIVPVPSGDAQAKPPPPAQEMPAYRSLTIVSPADDAVVEYSGGWVNVFVSVEPALGVDRGHLVRLRLDGRLLHTGTAGTTIAIPDVERGTHTLQAEIVDQTGTALIVSAPVTFYQQRPFVQGWQPGLPEIYPRVYPPQHPPRAHPKQPRDGDDRGGVPRPQSRPERSDEGASLRTR
jgi:hypothetical protein